MILINPQGKRYDYPDWIIAQVQQRFGIKFSENDSVTEEVYRELEIIWARDAAFFKQTLKRM